MMSPFEKRMLVYPWMVVWAYIMMCTYWIATGTGIFINSDFVCFYSASAKALYGKVSDIYDIPKLLEFERQIWEQIPGILPWVYPPTFLILISPLAILPYSLALFLWLAITLTWYSLVLHKIAPHRCTIGLVLAFPGTFINFCTGQNGFLSAFFLGAGLLLLERRPILAGTLLGLLTYKPQLALLVAVALIASRMWRAFAAACGTAITLIICSIVFYGVDSWFAFYNTLPVFTQIWLNANSASWQKMQTFFAFAKLIGLPTSVAYGLQFFFSLGAVIVVAWVWYKRIFPMANVILTASVLLATPYALVYDLPITGLTIGWYGWHGFKHGWLPGEKNVLALAWLMPFFSLLIAKLINIQITPIVLLAIIILAVRRVKAEIISN